MMCEQTAAEFHALYRKKTNGTKVEDLTGHQEAPYGYDSVWAVALALNATMNHMQRNRELPFF